MTVHHARISPTAKLAAFLRAESGIPYCRQIADMCDAEEVSRTFDAGFIANHRAYIELRFKSLNSFIRQLDVCAVISNKAGVERARNFLGITHVGDLTAIRDAALRAKKGGELGGGTDAGVMNSHDLPKFTTVRRIIH